MSPLLGLRVPSRRSRSPASPSGCGSLRARFPVLRAPCQCGARLSQHPPVPRLRRLPEDAPQAAHGWRPALPAPGPPQPLPARRARSSAAGPALRGPGAVGEAGAGVPGGPGSQAWLRAAGWGGRLRSRRLGPLRSSAPPTWCLTRGTGSCGYGGVFCVAPLLP